MHQPEKKKTKNKTYGVLLAGKFVISSVTFVILANGFFVEN